MGKYDHMLTSALDSIDKTFRNTEIADLGRNPEAILTKKPKQPDPSKDFTLVTWLIIQRRKTGKVHND